MQMAMERKLSLSGRSIRVADDKRLVKDVMPG
jgi:hypothetical protein